MTDSLQKQKQFHLDLHCFLSMTVRIVKDFSKQNRVYHRFLTIYNLFVCLKLLNPFMPNGLLYLHSSDRSISNIRSVWLVLLLPCFIEILVFNANSADPDQTPRFAASDLDLHRLPMSLCKPFKP